MALDDPQRQGLVAGGVEQHHHPVALLVGLDAALAPLRVPDPLAEDERPLVGVQALAAVAVVAVPAARGCDSPSSSSTMRRRQSVVSAYVRTISTADLAYRRCHSRRCTAASARVAAGASSIDGTAATRRSLRRRTAPTLSSALTALVSRPAARPSDLASAVGATGPSARMASSTPASSATPGPAPPAKKRGRPRSAGR